MSVEATLAELAVEIRHLREDFKEMKDESKQRQDKADESRARVHARLDVVAERVGALEGEHKATRDKLDDVSAVTDEVKRWKVMGMTSLSIVGIGAAALGITFSDAVKRMFHALVGWRM